MNPILFFNSILYCRSVKIQTYVQYMKFARRAEGIQAARDVFKKAREDIRSRYHVFVAAALMNYYCVKDKDVAFRIFELGLKKFGGNPDYVKCYVDYLSHLNGKGAIIARLPLKMALTQQISFLIQKRTTIHVCYLSVYFHRVV